MSKHEEGLPIPAVWRSIAGGALIALGGMGVGSAFGFTIEPETTTQMRIENAELRIRLENAKGNLDEAMIALHDLGEVCKK